MVRGSLSHLRQLELDDDHTYFQNPANVSVNGLNSEYPVISPKCLWISEQLQGTAVKKTWITGMA